MVAEKWIHWGPWYRVVAVSVGICLGWWAAERGCGSNHRRSYTEATGASDPKYLGWKPGDHQIDDLTSGVNVALVSAGVAQECASQVKQYPIADGLVRRHFDDAVSLGATTALSFERDAELTLRTSSSTESRKKAIDALKRKAMEAAQVTCQVRDTARAYTNLDESERESFRASLR